MGPWHKEATRIALRVTVDFIAVRFPDHPRGGAHDLERCPMHKPPRLKHRQWSADGHRVPAAIHVGFKPGTGEKPAAQLGRLLSFNRATPIWPNIAPCTFVQ
jgi:hypothetical protein